MASSTVGVGGGLVSDEHWMQGIWRVEESLGYRFRDKNLLLAALTHRSFCNENNTGTGHFDELEWLGDSVLQLAVSSWLFRTAKGSRRTSGKLSLTRVRFVDAGACESFAQQLNLVSDERDDVTWRDFPSSDIMVDLFDIGRLAGQLVVTAERGHGFTECRQLHWHLAMVLSCGGSAGVTSGVGIRGTDRRFVGVIFC